MTAQFSEECTKLLNSLQSYESLHRITQALLAYWPDHQRYIQASLLSEDSSPLERLEEVAQYIELLAGENLQQRVKDYKWLCERFREEQFYFFRHKKYRLSTVEEAIEQVYSNHEYMSQYMSGDLLAQIYWRNHALSMDIFRERFIEPASPGARYLEVGPGHGLYMAFAASQQNFISLTGWDLSATSLQDTKQALDKMVSRSVEDILLSQQDIVNATNLSPQFDYIMCSEVLEHTENPRKALENMHACMNPGGKLFLNVPVNSPAPDHIYLWSDPDDVSELVSQTGFSLLYKEELPPTGKSLEIAKKHDLDILCIIIAEKNA